MLVLIMRYSRSLPGPAYLPATAVIMAEIIKMVSCFIIHLYKRKDNLSIKAIYEDILGADSGWKAMIIPAGLYFVQNNLQYIAVTLLDGPTFQVTCQLKIITAALFSVSMLGKQLSMNKWSSLGLLAFGIALVQLSNTNGTKATSGLDRVFGLTAVIIASILSGLAGVWFEKVLKGGQTSLFIRNIQLSLFSVGPGLVFGGNNN